MNRVMSINNNLGPVVSLVKQIPGSLDLYRGLIVGCACPRHVFSGARLMISASRMHNSVQVVRFIAVMHL